MFSWALAEFECGLIRERKQAGLAAACTRGRVGCSKSRLDDQTVREIKALLCDPDTQVDVVARCYSVSRSTSTGTSVPSRRINEDLGWSKY